MKYRALLKKTFFEILRDPVVYVFCVCMPILMIFLFAIINHYTNVTTQIFEMESLIPGIIVFSFSFITLTFSLTISKDMKSAVLRRIYIAPIKTRHILICYLVVGIVGSFIQEILAILTGFIVSLILKTTYFNIISAFMLILVNIPISLIFIFLGIILGMLLSDTAAPGVSSILISASGILGGAWMPIESMGGFMIASSFLPFYPAVYLGRFATGAKTVFNEPYNFNSSNWYYLLVLILYMVILGFLSSIITQKKR